MVTTFDARKGRIVELHFIEGLIFEKIALAVSAPSRIKLGERLAAGVTMSRTAESSGKSAPTEPRDTKESSTMSPDMWRGIVQGGCRRIISHDTCGGHAQSCVT
jgi:hypothetical protein